MDLLASEKEELDGQASVEPVVGQGQTCKRYDDIRDGFGKVWDASVHLWKPVVNPFNAPFPV